MIGHQDPHKKGGSQSPFKKDGEGSSGADEAFKVVMQNKIRGMIPSLTSDIQNEKVLAYLMEGEYRRLDPQRQELLVKKLNDHPDISLQELRDSLGL
ncbi:MAG: hypothetical protein KGH93_01525 [Patescibacteria group bacterium]|nr:hypothetical protein [Patescibacteria group bacterium]MDE1945861.1 hypothetical protein [Patescibacteria group bacterium]